MVEDSPEVEGGHNVAIQKQNAAGKAHHRIIVATTQWRVRVSEYRKASAKGLEVALRSAGVVDPAVEL